MLPFRFALVPVAAIAFAVGLAPGLVLWSERPVRETLTQVATVPLPPITNHSTAAEIDRHFGEPFTTIDRDGRGGGHVHYDGLTAGPVGWQIDLLVSVNTAPMGRPALP